MVERGKGRSRAMSVDAASIAAQAKRVKDRLGRGSIHFPQDRLGQMAGAAGSRRCRAGTSAQVVGSLWKGAKILLRNLAGRRLLCESFPEPSEPSRRFPGGERFILSEPNIPACCALPALVRVEGAVAGVYTLVTTSALSRGSMRRPWAIPVPWAGGGVVSSPNTRLPCEALPREV